MRKTYVFYIFVLFFSCNNSKNTSPVFIDTKENIITGNSIFGLWVYSRDSINCDIEIDDEYRLLPCCSVKDNYKIKNDSIYLNSSKLEFKGKINGVFNDTLLIEWIDKNKIDTLFRLKIYTVTS